MLDEKKLDELRTKHGKLHIRAVDDTDFVLRAPSRLEYRKWKADIQDERKKLDASELLLLPCIVYPEPQDFQAMLDERPALADTLGLQLLEIAGMTKAVEKKLP